MRYAARFLSPSFRAPSRLFHLSCGLWAESIENKLEANGAPACGASLRAVNTVPSQASSHSLLCRIWSPHLSCLPHRGSPGTSSKIFSGHHHSRHLSTVQIPQPQRGLANPKLQWPVYSFKGLECIEICYNQKQSKWMWACLEEISGRN